MNLSVYQTNIPFEIELAVYSESSVVVEHIQTKKKQNVIPFIKGNGNAYFRYSSRVAGKYRYSYAGEKGAFTIRNYRGSNVLYRHGAVAIADKEHHLSYADGTHFFWLADTWWYGATNRARLGKEFNQLLSKRKRQHFSVVQLVVGIPPETDERSKESENAGGKPFLKDWTINLSYFDEVDKKIGYLVENGIVPCIVGGWGNHIDLMGIEPVRRLWQEIIARYGAYPVVFCLTGEVDNFLMPQQWTHRNRILRYAQHVVTRLLPKRAYKKLLERRIAQWQSIGEYIKRHDPFHRPLTVHVGGETTAYDIFGYQNNLFSMNTIQSGHGKDSVPFMVRSLRESHKKNIPFLNMEPWYEGILGNFNDYHQRIAFWISILCGAVGHSYGAHGIWQMAKPGDGFMKHWGKSSWQESLEFKGAGQLGRAKQFLAQHEWWKLAPAFDTIDPHWSEEHADYPIAGQIDNGSTFIYFPDAALPIKFTIQKLDGMYPYSALYINPATMKIVSSFMIRKNNYAFTVPHQLQKEDLLLLVMKRRK